MEHSRKDSSDKENNTDVEDLDIGDKPTADMSAATSHDSLKELIEKNIKWSQVVYNQNKAIKRRLTMMAVGNYIRLALILTPIVFGIIYLPSIIADTKARYESVISGLGVDQDISELLQQFLGGQQNSQKSPVQGRK